MRSKCIEKHPKLSQFVRHYFTSNDVKIYLGDVTHLILNMCQNTISHNTKHQASVLLIY